MSCERAVEVNSRVRIEFPPSWRDRRRACCASSRARCCNVWDCCVDQAGKLSFFLCSLAIFSSPFWIALLVVFLLADCQAPPNLTLEDVNIHNMVVYHNTTDSSYLVRSELSVNLTAWNPNGLTKCFSTFRRMSVSVEFKGQQIVQQEVPLGFGLKPKENRTVMLDLREDGYALKKESALLLDLELRNSSGTGLLIFFNSRVMRNDRKASWMRKRCDTITRTPPNGNFSQANSTGGLAWSSCDYN